MKWSHAWAFLGAAGLLLLCAPSAGAQEMVFNGDFETGSLNHGWTLFGGNANTITTTFAVVYNQPSLCVKRKPGTPGDNGGIQQEVHLLGGVTYAFSANIAAQYCSS